jgi:signal-transduction protein with cAMP-binding, CBS, and nucleotidyltransferase domain
MKKNKIHRVIVEDTKTSTFTGFITYETIFDYFVNNYYSDMLAFHININELNIKKQNIITVSKNETIYNCLLCFWNFKISVLPIIDGDTNFGFFFLKDIVYFFSNGEKFSVKILLN